METTEAGCELGARLLRAGLRGSGKQRGLVCMLQDEQVSPSQKGGEEHPLGVKGQSF
jgi:hypothetical protein